MNLADDRTALVDELFDRIRTWPLADPRAAIGFEDRLADDNGWTRGFALRVTAEYRRFLLLTQVAGHVVTPSREVDAAWHLHLTRTRDYRAMCDAVFGRFLHHDPSQGGAGQLEHYRGLYERTLESYRRVFGEEPPADIWPPVHRRFAAAPAFGEAGGVDGSVRVGAAAVRVALALSVVGGFVAYALGVSGPWLRLPGGPWLVVYLLGIVGIALLATHLTAAARASAPAAGTLDAEEAALLSGGKGRVALAAITALVCRGALRLQPARDAAGKITGAAMERTEVDCAGPALDPAARALAALPAGPVTRDAVLEAIDAPCGDMERRLQRSGLRADPSCLGVPRVVVLGLSLVLLALASNRLAMALATEGAFLLHLGLMGLNLWQVRVLARVSEETAEGAAALQRESRQIQQWLSGRAASKSDPVAAALSPAQATVATLAAAVVGTQAVIDDPQFAGINFVIPEGQGHQTGSSGGAAGCEADAGCGGCGGCGG